MAVSPLDHTADTGIEVRAADLDELFADAARGLCAAITDPAGVAPSEQWEVEVAAGDLERLMVDWLEELLFRFDVERLLPASAGVTVSEEPVAPGTAGGWRLRGTVRGERFDPERHPLAVAVKAITYHGLLVERRDDGWHARVIFDI